MARVTVEDCLENVKNRFELVMLAAKRARQLMRGSAEPKVAWENDKATVVALREIAMGYTDFSDAHHAEPLAHLTQHAAPIAPIMMDEEDDDLDNDHAEDTTDQDADDHEPEENAVNHDDEGEDHSEFSTDNPAESD